MKAIDMRKEVWMEQILEQAESLFKEITESDFIHSTDERPEYDGNLDSIELRMAHFPIAIPDACHGEPDEVRSFSELFKYIKSYEKEIGNIHLFDDEYGDGGIHYRCKFAFIAHHEYGDNPEKKPFCWAEIKIMPEEI